MSSLHCFLFGCIFIMLIVNQDNIMTTDNFKNYAFKEMKALYTAGMYINEDTTVPCEISYDNFDELWKELTIEEQLAIGESFGDYSALKESKHD